MKKNNFVFFLIVISLLIVPTSLFAQRGGAYIGKIDVRTVFLLHPSMIQYNFEKQAFKITRDKVSLQNFKNEEKNNSNEINKLNNLMKSISGKIREEEKKYQKKLDNLNKQYLSKITEVATGQAAMNKMSYNIESGKEEVSHNAKLTALYAQYSDAEEKLLKISQFGYNEAYTTLEETNQRFANILKEIKSYTQRAADQKGISVVLNASYKRILAKDNVRTNNNSGYVPEDMSFGSIFTRGFPQDLIKDEEAVKGFYTNVYTLTQNWLNNGDSIVNRLKSPMLENDIFIGGVDLTGEVLSALYKAYKLDPNISNTVIKSALSY